MVYRARDGSTMSCTYDNRGRETFCDYSDPATPDVTNTYDAAGRKLSCSTTVAAHTYSYDAANQLLSETTSIPQLPNPLITGYAYNADGLRSSLTYPDGSVVNYAYTARNQVKEIKRGSVVLAAYTYDLAGNRLTKELERSACKASSPEARRVQAAPARVAKTAPSPPARMTPTPIGIASAGQLTLFARS